MWRFPASAGRQRLFQRNRAIVLFQQVSNSVFNEFLHGVHTVQRQCVQRLPGVGVEGDQLALAPGGNLERGIGDLLASDIGLGSFAFRREAARSRRRIVLHAVDFRADR